jgi:N-carbamoylputrescine amidase
LLSNARVAFESEARDMNPVLRHFTVGLIQMRCSDDSEENLRKASALLRRAADQGVQVACLPELFRTRYFCQSEDSTRFELAEPIPGPTTEALAQVARETKMVVVGSIFERRAPGLYHNTAVVLDSDGAVRGTYRKMHIPDDPLYYEKYYFTPGDLGFRTFDTSFARVGTLVCWDQWYPEAARLTALQGAEILFYPTAIGWHPAEKDEFGPAQLSAWETIQRSHAIANGVYVAAVNRIGHEGPAGGGLEFWGGSFVADPFGRVIAKAGPDTEEVVIARCDLKLQEETRRNWPFLRDRRIDAYAPITERYLDQGTR